MTNFFRTGMFTISVVAFAQMSAAGGWEASTLDTSFMYNEGNYAEVGTASVTYNVKATTQANTAKTKMAKNYHAYKQAKHTHMHMNMINHSQIANNLHSAVT